ncbi:MAG: hypothetical protein KJ561_02745 [Nanoarchaeota archaeon]|nr:hypothetical protein [Nanoarchaeota archaeon]
MAKKSIKQVNPKNIDSIRGWINTLIQILTLIILIMGFFEVYKLNINLDKFTANEVEIKGKIKLGNTIIYNNGTCLITKVNNTESIICP